MTDEELKNTIEEIKAEIRKNPEHKNKTDDEFDLYILEGFTKAYEDGKLPLEELLAIGEAMGYELTDDEEENYKPTKEDFANLVK